MKKMMRKLIYLNLLMFLICAIPPINAQYEGGDTGTYEITDYRVLLTPRADGTVDINYTQTWHVTGGHIPWITIGTPNSNFSIKEYGGDAAGASTANYGSWSGFKINLNKDYRAGENFTVNAAITQNRLFYADDKNYHLDFTPGWYDRADTRNLEIKIKCFFKMDSLKIDPKPTTVGYDLIIWNAANLKRGARYKVSISFPKEILPGAIPEKNLKQKSASSESNCCFMLLFWIVVVIIVWFIIARSITGGYSGGGLFYGGRGSSGGSGSSRRSTGGGGGFGGRSSSCACACACVSCACACACAGGGGAGCARKNEYTCKYCEEKRKDEA